MFKDFLLLSIPFVLLYNGLVWVLTHYVPGIPQEAGTLGQWLLLRAPSLFLVYSA